ncbi:hypothetical protein [Streptomyces sp. W1SF4]|uniref:hypothetical protein n=1 Tax=Streptomyces sp. W1SF4 TaxID=2305220 RepID=UPI000F709D47|nr:hypothetical protein [Streptomyces sp. W1SF4]AZM91446.1 hypothetical protein D1J60_25665 [Streptomyces sp. W1SF4]
MADARITQIIPPGAPLPPRPPEPGEIPPWRPTPPPPPPAEPRWYSAPEPAPPPGEIVHRVQVHLVYPEPEPEPSRWERFAAWLRRFGQPWQAAAAITLAVTPIPGVGYSAATTWAYVVDSGRAIGPWQPYALGCIPCALVVARILRRGATVRLLFLLVVTGFGVYGAVDWFDAVTIITGVTR